MFLVFKWLTSLVYPHLMYLSLVTRLFKQEASMGMMPVDPLNQTTEKPQEMLLKVQTRLKQRKSLPRNSCILCYYHVTEFMTRVMCCCRSNNFFRSIAQGKAIVRRELDLFYYLKHQRLIQATLLAITTHEQRRLIKQQVKTGLFVAPFKSEVSIFDEFKNFRQRRKTQKISQKLWTSSMEEDSSEEDFEFLSQYLEEHNGLPYGAMKLLRGCVQFEYKDRKYPGRFGRG